MIGSALTSRNSAVYAREFWHTHEMFGFAPVLHNLESDGIAGDF
jgi:hypothetical protein